MSKVEEMRQLLKDVGMPKAQLSDICCLSMLAMAGIKPEMEWNQQKNFPASSVG